MALSAHDVAAVLRDRLPGLPTKKLHKLLYYCQGHHLAAFDEPLFSETISAWDMGPVVGTMRYAERQNDVPRVHREMNEAQLNTVGYVLSRYGALTGRDLAWVELESPKDDLRCVVMAWILTRYDDPYQGVRRERGFANLWFASIPNSDDGSGNVVVCSYWIEESRRTVRCDNFGTLSLPL